MKDPNRLCLGCMNEWGDPDRPCPSCGFVMKNYERPLRQLPLRQILNGKYMIGKAIGEGGFGITYLGWDLNLQVRVAVKEYFPVGLATRETGSGRSCSIMSLPGVRQENYRQGLEKFMTEAKNLSKFYDLPGIVAVKDFFFENDTAYMIMEFVDGITLGTYLKDHGGQVTEQEVLQLFHPVMESLKVVHQSGIIHRDISPDNVMMTKDGQMKLIDFGAARFAGGQDTERSLTIILKHGYAPAEQYQSHGNQGPWTDVYAICATMYRMITGKVPPGAMDRLHEDTLEEFRQLGCQVSDQTAHAIIDQGLALKVEERYQDMDELIEGLYGINSGKIRRKKRRSRSPWPVIGGAAVVCAVCLAAGIFLLSGGRSGQAGDGTAGQSTSAGLADSAGTASRPRKDPASVSAEELALLQAEALEAGRTMTAAGNHLISLREDGTAAASGVNGQGNLEVEKWSRIQAVSTGTGHTVGVREDGSAVAVGDAGNGKCAVDSWKTITAADAGGEHTLGRREDGTVIAAGSNDCGQCEVSSWSQITDVAAGAFHSLGLKEDGTVIAAGDDQYGQCQVDGWEGIVKIYARGNVSAGLRADGTVVLAGDVEGLEDALAWKQVIALDLGEHYAAALLSDHSVRTAGNAVVSQEQVNGWEEIEAIAAADDTLFGRRADGSIIKTSHTYGTVSREGLSDLQKVVSGGGYLAGLTFDGTVQIWGISGEDFGQAEAGSWTDIQDLAASETALLGLRSDGTVCVLGEGYEEASGWTDIRQAALTGDLALGLKSDGTLVYAGPAASEGDLENWYSISAHRRGGFEGELKVKAIAGGLDGEAAVLLEDGTVAARKSYINDLDSTVSIAAGKEHIAAVLSDGTVSVNGYYLSGYANVYSWQDVIQTAAGADHTVGLKSDGTVLAVGSNSNGQCSVSDWTDVVYVAAGAYYTLGVQSDGSLLIAGKIPGEYD